MLALCLEELEAVGWKEVDVLGREYGLQKKLFIGVRAHQGCPTLVEGWLLVAKLLGRIPVSQRGGIWNLIKWGLGDRTQGSAQTLGDKSQTLHVSIQRPRKTNEVRIHVKGEKMMK